MREGPLDTLDRHRSTFVDSLFDGIGKADAGADFYLSAISAERKGYKLSVDDETLIKMFGSIIAKQSDPFYNTSSQDQQEVTGSQVYDLDNEIKDSTLRETGVSQFDVATDLGSRGDVLSDNPSYKTDRVMHAEPGSAGNLAGHKWTMEDGDLVEDPHATSNYIGDMQERFVDHLGDFFLADNPIDESQSQIDHHKESSWEDWTNSNEHDFLLNEYHFGRLGTVGKLNDDKDFDYLTNHSLYQHHYNQWERDNADRIDERKQILSQQGMDDNEIEHEMRKIHMDQAKRDWQENLGFLDFMLGLEWLTPEERESFYDHVEEHGASDITQPFKLNRHNMAGNPDFIPRAKRNFAQRFSGLYDSWTRGAAYPGQGLKKEPIGLPDDVQVVERAHNTLALDEHRSPGKTGSAMERAIAYMNEMMRDYYFDQMPNRTPPQYSASDIPTFEELEDGSFDVDTVPRFKADKKSKFGGRYNHVSYDALKLMLGIDENNQIFEDNSHPVWGSYWKKDNAPFSQEEVDKIMNSRGKAAKQLAASGRMSKNHGYMHYGHHINGDKYDYSDDDNTLATYWHSMYIGGGLGKMPNDLFDLIHHHSVLFEPDYASDEGAQTEEKTARQLQAELDDEKDFLSTAQIDEREEQIRSKIREEMLREEYGEEEISTDDIPLKRRMDGAQEHSLFFSRTGNSIMPRVRLDSQLERVDSGLSSLLGPFGQPELGLFNMIVGQGKMDQVSFRGDIQDSLKNMGPFNVNFSRSQKGSLGENLDMARHSGTVDSAHKNKVFGEYNSASQSGNYDDEARRAAHAEIIGRDSIGLSIHNPFVSGAGRFDEMGQRNKNAHHHKLTSYLLGFARPPMFPLKQPLTREMSRRPEHLEHHPLANPEDMESIKRRQLTSSKFDIEQELSNLKEEYETNLSRTDDEDKRQELKEEYERRKNRLESDGQFVSEDAAREGIVQQPLGLLYSRLSASEPITEEEERFITLSDLSATLQSRLFELQDPEGFARDSQSRGIKQVADELGQTSSLQRQTSEEREKDFTELGSMLDLDMSDPDAVQNKLKELTGQLSELEPALNRLGGGLGAAGMGSLPKHQDAYVSRFRDKLHADTLAIRDAAIHLVENEIDPNILSEILNPNLPIETVAANVRMLARMANEYLHKAPHQDHGIHTLGHGEHNEEGDSAQQALGQIRTDLNNHDNSLTPSDNLSLIQASQSDSPQEKQALLSQLADKLGIDKDDPRQIDTLARLADEHMLDAIKQNGTGYSPPIMTVRQYYQQQYPDFNIEEALTSLGRFRSREKGLELFNNLKRLESSLSQSSEKYGVKLHTANNSDDREIGPEKTLRRKGKIGDNEYTVKPTKAGGKSSVKNESQVFRAKQMLDSILVGMPEVEEIDTSITRRGMGRVPVDRFGPNSHSVHSLYDSAGFRHEQGDLFRPNFNFKINPRGKVNLELVDPMNNPQKLLQPLESFWEAVSPPEWLEMLRNPEHAIARESLNNPFRFAAQRKPNSIDATRNQDAHSTTKSEIGLADLTNPDIIRKELGSKVPLLQPMHRIFDISDLEHLRGFTGDWIVSHMPEGERGFVEKKDDEVSSKSFDLSDDDKDNFKEVTDEDFNADVIKLEDGYYIFDVIEFAGKEVHDVPLDDRIKILRGGMEGVENVHLPSASDTRLSDDIGLKSVVKDLQKEHENILLRDAKSVYMAGEMRHPKWVMLKPGRDVVLRVLERRGSGPYTYRLGTGPITQDDKIGDRAVQSDGETYMDLGAAFNSPDKYNVGDHVRVNVANVSKVESAEDDTIYTLTGSEIEGEAEGEGLVSQETLSMLAKSDNMQWLCEVHRAKSGIRVVMPQGDVVYKATESLGTWTVHSPLASNNYLVRLSESQRVYWSPIAGALLKADLEVKEEVHESKGDGKPLIPPKKIQDAQWWRKKQKRKVLVKGLTLIDKFMKSGVGAVGQSSTGTMGLGIGYATPIESPMGPTNLHDEKTMPDYDNRKRPGEDSPIEPDTEEKDEDKRMTVPTEGGELEITEDKAILHT